jgi:transposase-like protein
MENPATLKTLMEPTPTTEIHRRHFTAQQKIAILRQRRLEGVPVSTLCDQHQINPTLFDRWQKELFENGAAAFAKPPRSPSAGNTELTLQRLEHKLRQRDEALAELMQEHVALKTGTGRGVMGGKSLGES